MDMLYKTKSNVDPNVMKYIDRCMKGKKIGIDAGHPLVFDPKDGVKDAVSLDFHVGLYNLFNPEKQIPTSYLTRENLEKYISN